MLSKENLEQFTKKYQTDIENAAREYCQHLFLSFLYQQPGSEKLLFKGGTALRMLLKSPRFSEDLDFTGSGIRKREVEAIFIGTLAEIERTGIKVEISEGKPTTEGYLGIAAFSMYEQKVRVQIEVSFRNGRQFKGIRTLVQSDYLPPYTLVHLPIEGIIGGKLEALASRRKPRDFYDYYFLLSGNYPMAKDKKNLEMVLKLLRTSKINFRAELKKFLPASHAMHLKNFSKILEQKTLSYSGEKIGLEDGTRHRKT